jgi:hypothetical protein
VATPLFHVFRPISPYFTFSAGGQKKFWVLRSPFPIFNDFYMLFHEATVPIRRQTHAKRPCARSHLPFPLGLGFGKGFGAALCFFAGRGAWLPYHCCLPPPPPGACEQKPSALAALARASPSASSLAQAQARHPPRYLQQPPVPRCLRLRRMTQYFAECDHFSLHNRCSRSTRPAHNWLG